MRRAFAALLGFLAIAALGQTPDATIRVEVKTEAGPVSDATVTASGKSLSTGENGVAVLLSSPGQIDVS